MKESSKKTSCIIYSYFYKIPENVLYSILTEKKIIGFMQMEVQGEMGVEEHKETFTNDGNVCYHFGGDGFI